MLTPTRLYGHDYGKPLSKMDASNTPASHNASASSGKKKAWQRSTVALSHTCSVWFLALQSCLAHTRAYSSCSERAVTCNDMTSLRFRFRSACTTPGFALERRFGDKDWDVDCHFQIPHNLCFEDDVYTRYFYDNKRTWRNGLDEGLGLWLLRLNTISYGMNYL
jgi:hypothetical protein